MDFDTIFGSTLAAWMAPLLPSQKAFWLYLLGAFVISGATWLFFSRREESARPDGIEKGFLGFLFDPAVWWHRSAQQDYLYFMLNALIYYGIVAQLLVSGHVFIGAFGHFLDAAFGARETPVFAPSAATAAAYTLAVVLTIDLAVWTTHYLQHRIALLWQFHQVHHSAEVLTPATVYRMHPVDLFFTGIVTTGLIGLAIAGFTYLTQSKPSEITVMNVNILIFAFYLVGYNLRHSHVWLAYPQWLSHILISPAQHQIHHSVERRHWDRNMGLVFAVWDWAFGTLYVPKGYEKLRYGINSDAPNPFASVTEIYVKPFRMAWALIRPRMPRRGTLLALAAIGAAAILIQGPGFSGGRTLPSLHMEDLTWTEVALALETGHDTVIVPTGGTEQNGPHAILGKHNYIVREAAGRIAERLGHTLVAPVIAYVPEGNSGEAPTGHMRWSGTLSLPEPVFEAVLEHAARSLATHGFTRILFVGDSRENQAPQARVAEALSRAWQDRGIQVIHVGDYYEANGQVEDLLAQGFSMAEIGQHAALRDTSELIAVHPAGVRTDIVAPPRGADAGFDGDPAAASPEIGERLIELKVEAALRQIRGPTGVCRAARGACG